MLPIGAITGLLGAAGGAIPAAPSAGPSQSGDASAGLSNPFSYNASFQVGGSGKQTQSQTSENGGDNTVKNNTTVYIIAGVAGLAVLGVLIYALRRSK